MVDSCPPKLEDKQNYELKYNITILVMIYSETMVVNILINYQLFYNYVLYKLIHTCLRECPACSMPIARPC